MNHQPFKDLLLSQPELSGEQSVQLQAHLNTCESCRQFATALIEVDDALEKAPIISPAPGFSARWQAKLAQYQQQKQRQNSWIVIGVTTLLVISISIVLGTQFWSFLQAPGPFMVEWLNRMLAVASIFLGLWNLAESFSAYSLIYAFAAGFLLVGIVSFISVFWLAAYRKLSMARRIS